eukprot:488956-Rhodomonas_salina.1
MHWHDHHWQCRSSSAACLTEPDSVSRARQDWRIYQHLSQCHTGKLAQWGWRGRTEQLEPGLIMSRHSGRGFTSSSSTAVARFRGISSSRLAYYQQGYATTACSCEAHNLLA